MPGAWLDKKNISILRENLPKGVSDVLSGSELSILDSLDERNLHPDDRKEIKISLEEIMGSVRSNIFDGLDLPDNFPSVLDSDFRDESNDIGIIVDADNVDIDQIKAWIIETLASHNEVPKNKIISMLEFGNRTWIDGPISVQIIHQADVEKIKRQLSGDPND